MRRQPRAESHLLDRQIPRYEIDLIGQRNSLLRRDPQREPEKIRHQLRHLTRVIRARSAQRCNGIETVEQKVRIDLSLERLELRFARQYLVAQCRFSRDS